MGIDPVSIFLFVASTAYQQNQQKKMKQKMEAEAEKRKGFKFSASGTVEHLPVVYGKQVIGGVQTLHKTRHNYTNSTQEGDVFKAGSWDGNRGGSKNEFLLVQSALCQDGIESCQYVKVNDKPYNHVEKSIDNDQGSDSSPYDNIISVKSTGGSANALATANGIASTNVFTDAANATAIYRLNRDQPQYQGVPSNSFFVLGRKVRDVVNSGGSYVLSSNYSYSNNPALCLLDYLLGSFGRGLDVTEVDLYSFYKASQICSQVVTTGRTIGGRINGVKPIKELSTLSVFPNTGDSDFIYKAEDTGIFYNWNGSSYTTTTVPTRDIPLYECNIALDSEATVRDNIEEIMNTMGLAELIWTSEGKYKLILDYPSSQSALEALVDTKHNFDEDDIIRETVTLSYPAANDRFNRVTVRFDNEHEDFKEDSMSWPDLNGSVHTQYLSEDNQQPMTTDLYLKGITDPYHALAKAEQMVRQSRTMHYLTFTVGKSGLSLEPGDFVKVNLPQSGIYNDIYRVESITIAADLTVELKCYYFDHTALAWNINDDIAYGQQPTYDFSVPTISNTTITPVVFTSTDGTTYTSLEVNWDAVDSVSVSRYEIQWKKSSDTFYRSAYSRTTNYVIQNVEPNVAYDVRVRVITTLGINGNFDSASGTNAGKDVDPNPASDLSANGGLGFIELTWTNPADVDFKEIEIYEGPDNNFSNSISIGSSSGSSFIRANLGPAVRKYYWIRSKDKSGNTSTFIGPENDITLRVTAGDIADTAIPYSAFDTGVTGIFDDILEDITGVETGVSNNSSAITAIDTRVTAAETSITTQASSITALESDLTTANTGISGNATAITGLDTRVTDAESDITAQASSITTLTTSVGDNTTSISTQATSISGIQAQHSVEIDNNGSITGYRLISDANTNSAFNVRADQFNVSATDGTDFNIFSVRTSAETISGVLYPAGVYVDGYFTADKIVTDDLASLNADLGTITAGVMQSSDGNMVIDLNNKTITIEV